MATESGIIEAWATLRGAGLVCPWKSEEELQDALRTWGRLLSDLTDEQLQRATDAHCRVSEWWPRPAQLLALVPRAAPPPQDEHWPGKRWAGLDNRTRIALMDEAVRTRTVHCPQHAGARASVTSACDACATVLGRTLDELAHAHLKATEPEEEPQGATIHHLPTARRQR